MLKSLLLAASLFAPSACAAAVQTPAGVRTQAADADGPVTRRVGGQTLVSAERPGARIKFDKAFKYAGGHSFVLYGVAQAEQHFFVDADREGRVRRLYWVQFEGYLPSNTHAYDYSGVKERVNLGGLDFVTDAVAVNIAQVRAQRPDSDGAKARAFLESKGYRVAGNDFMWRRLVHLTDATRRDELMIIYLEDLGGTGLTAADLTGDGSATARWPEISRQLLRRATKGMKITRD
jgi:hypothetical protein